MRLFITLALLVACSTPATAPTPTGAGPEPASADAPNGYTCPMHPFVHMDAPGKCPVCLMTLVPATAPAAASAPAAVTAAATPATTAPLEAHDHRSLHGGQVSMFGDHHVEYVGANDEYHFWVTNATREPITTGLSGSVKDGDTTIPLTADNATGLLTAHGEGAGSRAVMVEVTADGATFSLGFGAVPAAGAAVEHEHHHQQE